MAGAVIGASFPSVITDGSARRNVPATAGFDWQGSGLLLKGGRREATLSLLRRWGCFAMSYRTIVVDPPWRYRTTRGITTTAKTKKPEAANNYPTMTNAEIAALVLPAEENAHLYLWTTNPLIFGDGAEEPDPASIMAGWGFRYITLLTWVKTGTAGMGYYFRGNTEHCLFGIRGKAPIPPAIRVPNVFTAPKSGHSSKPELFYDIVERVSPSPWLEMFARRNRLGWHTWGNESIEHIEVSV